MHQWYVEDLPSLLKCCAIIHNMIVSVGAGPLDENLYDEPQAARFTLFGRTNRTQRILYRRASIVLFSTKFLFSIVFVPVWKVSGYI